MNTENRDNIRQTWGGWKVDHRVLFLLGTVESQDLQRKIQSESDFFQDIVQGNFVDTYRNLSYKHVMAMKWATEFCPETQFIFKSDDDIFVNTPFILHFVNRLTNMNSTRDFIFCVLNRGPPVMRDEKEKWYISPEEYPNATYPVYCPGFALLLTTDVAQKLHKAAETTPFFWVEDAYVLGILREKINVRITAVNDLLLRSKAIEEIFVEKTRNATDCLKNMFSVQMSSDHIKDVWHVVKEYQDNGYYTNITESEFAAPDRRFLIDLRDFDYVNNQKSCRQLRTQPKFIVLIHSAPRNRENRDNIRQSWGGWRIDHRVLFLLGTVESQDLQREIQTESDFFQDIVQGNFVDSYRNLSYKHIMAMKWATEFCPETKFIFKSDDDIFVNTALISQFIQRVGHLDNFIICALSWKPKVVRDKDCKWYVSPEEYPNATYPVYCPGCGVLLTSDVAQKLHKAAERTPFFWVDDAYVLGILREKINVKITAVNNLLLKSRITDNIFYDKTRNITDSLNTMFSFELKNDQIKELWQVVKKYQENGYYAVNSVKTTNLIRPIN
ncbi:uncharacterized protein LOC132261050 [Phlebotomus argentipes]|uniref:uncharacterized protein LOC132261050 n=1 Tax=Phlebotomus argentipes TaxID=94469 RepID=UPI002893138F|nr:uncharacterized protein LOC132261050 [Phlebotomus argentipes]